MQAGSPDEKGQLHVGSLDGLVWEERELDWLRVAFLCCQRLIFTDNNKGVLGLKPQMLSSTLGCRNTAPHGEQLTQQ